MKKTLALLMALSAIGLVACGAKQSVPDPPQATDCPAACVRGRDQLRCSIPGLKENLTSPAGRPCEEWLCGSLLNTDRRSTCMSHAADCEVWKTCATDGF